MMLNHPIDQTPLILGLDQAAFDLHPVSPHGIERGSIHPVRGSERGRHIARQGACYKKIAEPGGPKQRPFGFGMQRRRNAPAQKLPHHVQHAEGVLARSTTAAVACQPTVGQGSHAVEVYRP